MNIVIRLLISTLAVALVGCADTGQKEQIGTVLGGALGGIGGGYHRRGYPGIGGGCSDRSLYRSHR
jgi:hypothetical protein